MVLEWFFHKNARIYLAKIFNMGKIMNFFVKLIKQYSLNMHITYTNNITNE